MSDCQQNRDPLKLVREGTSQEQRLSPALEPAYAPIDEHTIAHKMVFAQAYAKYLKYYNSNNAIEGDWQVFFNSDVSVQLAIAAVQDVDYYRSNIKGYFDFLKNHDNKSKEQSLKDNLGYLFSCAGTLAKQMDVLKEGLPAEISFKVALQNLIQSQLAPALKNLMLYYRDGLTPPSPDDPYLNDKEPTFGIMGAKARFEDVIKQGLSKDWISEDNATKWVDYSSNINDLSKYPSTTIYGSGNSVFDRVNYIATHNLFTSIFDQFLKAYARTVKEAGQALEKTFTEWDHHEPHYALFLAFLRLLEYARAEMNTLTGRHLDFYYREILKLKEKAAEPGHAHLLVELAKHVDSHEFKKGELFKAGKDDLGKDAFFANDINFVANQAKVAALKTVYRHGEKNLKSGEPTYVDRERLFASPVANSDNGLGAELISVDKSWHPFHNKIYKNGKLFEIKMPKAEVGFAIASHYLLMAGGKRTVTVEFRGTSGLTGLQPGNKKDDIVCLFTAEKGWFEKSASEFNKSGSGALSLKIILDGADPAVVPYSAKTHGYNFATNLPVLLVKLKHRDKSDYIYSKLQDIVVEQIDLKVDVTGLKTLSVSNNFGPVDTSKPFQPFGALPVANSALIIGSKEAFQKTLTSASVGVTWLTAPTPYNKTSPQVNIDFLKEGGWLPSNITPINVNSTTYAFTSNLSYPVVDEPDLTLDEQFSAASRHGFARLKLTSDFGQNQYQADLLKYIRKEITTEPVKPVAPTISELWVDYSASQPINLNSTDADAFNKRNARFFHIAPFGHAEQHPFLSAEKKVYLLPRFVNEAEFYIGITDLKPPQNLSLLFQVVDGTADPLSENPDIHWSYLSGNEWIPFDKNEVEDRSGGLLKSGIITFAIPRNVSDANILLPAGMHWIRAAVEEKSDAVCRLQLVAAQALEATFIDKGNDPAFPAKVLEAGTISKLDQPDASVKKITQPFASFGGRGKEEPKAFYTRVSERLRHKDRGITLWDYERLILEAFPQIYKAKCLNHTQYEPNEGGTGIYRELAPGNVTVVTIPNQQFHKLSDPLQPYTGLGLLEEIEAFLKKRLSSFVKLYVRNPELEEVKVECKVRLYDGLDETFYLNKLQEAITRFLSPWAFPGGGNLSFGGKIYKSALINFVEDLPYVDYVIDFQLFHTFYDINGKQQTVKRDEIEGSKAVSILVSAREHSIKAIKPAKAETPGEKCPCEAK